MTHWEVPTCHADWSSQLSQLRDVKLLYWVHLNVEISSQNTLPYSAVRVQKQCVSQTVTIEQRKYLKDDFKNLYIVREYSQSLDSLTRDLLQLVVYGIRISALHSTTHNFTCTPAVIMSILFYISGGADTLIKSSWILSCNYLNWLICMNSKHTSTDQPQNIWLECTVLAPTTF